MPDITIFYAGILSLLMAVLSIRVPMRRAKLDQAWGGGGDIILETRIRVFGNFIEYVPMILLLMWMLEKNLASSAFLHGIGIGLITVRVIHAAFLTAGPMTLLHKLGRGVGAMGTWLLLVSCAIYLISLSRIAT